MAETVKTAISMQKPLLEKAEQAAKEMNLSRSGLISVALEDYLYRKDVKAIQDSWNAAYPEGQTDEDKELVREMALLHEETLEDEEW